MAQLRQDFAEFEKRGVVILVIGPEDAGAFARYFKQHDLASAEAAFARACSLDRLDAAPWVRLAQTYFYRYSETKDNGDIRRAIDAQLAAIARAPDRVSFGVRNLRSDISTQRRRGAEM